MHQQHVAGRQIGQQIFGAPAEAGDGLACEPLGEILSAAASADRRGAPRPAKRAPSMAGSRPRRTVSTSGSSGIRSSCSTSTTGLDFSALRRSRLVPRNGEHHAGSGRRLDRDPQSHFGFRTVNLDDKQALVDEVFHKVAPRYDLMNDLMSAGLHRAWKNALATAVNPPRNARPFAVLDVAGGTGNVAFRIAAAGGAGTNVDGLRHQCRTCWMSGASARRGSGCIPA